jgi:hypothetical protein
VVFTREGRKCGADGGVSGFQKREFRILASSHGRCGLWESITQHEGQRRGGEISRWLDLLHQPLTWRAA